MCFRMVGTLAYQSFDRSRNRSDHGVGNIRTLADINNCTDLIWTHIFKH